MFIIVLNVSVTWETINVLQVVFTKWEMFPSSFIITVSTKKNVINFFSMKTLKHVRRMFRRFILITTKGLSIFEKNDHKFYVYKINAKRILEFGIIEFPGKSGSHEQTKQLQKCSAIKQKWSILFR